jgi:hypothetical protein
MGVTDHSEYIGVIQAANDPNSPLSKLPIAEKLKVHDKADIQRIYLFLGASFFDGIPIKELVSPEIAANVWKRNVQMADEELSGRLSPGSSTLFVLVRKATPDRDKVLEDLKGTGGKILKTSLSHEDEAKLQAALSAAR